MISLATIDLCRVCLTDRGSIPIFKTEDVTSTSVHSKLNLCFGEEVFDVPGYPKNICETCNNVLDNTIALINKYKQSCRILEKVLQDDDNKDKFNENDFADDEIKSIIKEESYDENELKNESTIEEKLQDAIKEEVFILNESVTIRKIKNVTKNEELNKIDETENYIDSDIEFNDSHVKTENEEPVLSEKKNKVNNAKRKTNLKTNLKKLKSDNNLEINGKNKKNPRHNLNSKSLTSKKQITTKSTDKVIKKKNSSQKKLNTEIKETNVLLKEKSETQSKILCEICGKYLADRAKLTSHKEFQHSETKNLNCSVCSKTFRVEYGLKRHMKRMHSTDRQQCSGCAKSFTFKSDLKKHYNMVHLKERAIKRHSCKICGKLYGSTKDLKVHERAVHTGERPVQCNVCNASFFHSDYLKQHMRLHTGERPFKCPVCEKSFAQSCNMKSHIKHNHSISQIDEETLKNIHPRYLKFFKP